MKVKRIFTVLNIPKDGYQTQLNNQVKDSLNIKQNNKSLLKVVMMTMINKKTIQRVCCFNWKNRDGV